MREGVDGVGVIRGGGGEEEIGVGIVVEAGCEIGTGLVMS
jgi:hypothetical protein